jgi:hypothetical protein
MTDRDLVDRLIIVLSREAGLRQPADLLKRSGVGREQFVCKFRDDAIYLAREHTKGSGLSWEKLALWFGARHHATLIGAHRRVLLRLKQNPPRRDGRTWSTWHAHVMNLVHEASEEEMSCEK